MSTPAARQRDTQSIPELAYRLGIDPGTAYRLAKSDELPVPVIRVGKRLLVSRTAVDRLLSADAITAANEGGGDDAAA